MVPGHLSIVPLTNLGLKLLLVLENTQNPPNMIYGYFSLELIISIVCTTSLECLDTK